MPDDIADVYRSTYPALVRFLYRKVWDAERAEDLAQEAFARALVRRPENTRGWLFVVAANMARDEARRAAREKRHLTLLKSEPDAVHSSPEEDIDAETRTRRVRAALDELTPRDREALLLGCRDVVRRNRRTDRIGARRDWKNVGARAPE